MIERAKKTLEWVKNDPHAPLLTIVLNYLSLGRAYFLQAQSEGKNDYKQAQDYLNVAVAGFREAGTQHYLPLGLLARAFLYRAQDEFSNAWADLAEAREIAERGGDEAVAGGFSSGSGKALLGRQRTENGGRSRAFG